MISLDLVPIGQVLKPVTMVTSLTRAITMFGLNTVQNMALSTVISKSFHHGQQLAREGGRRQRAFVALGNIYCAIYDIGSAGDMYPSE